ncbi:MAG: hypothetical protein HY280_02985 [Nitrospinae bacterium]|nr:hypothetical protein [Nitrospinota bacterium]
MANNLTFNVFFKKTDNVWTGHCLELDIVVESKNLSEVKKDMSQLIMAQVDYAFSNDNLDNLYHPAPPEVWAEFWKCKEIHERKVKIHSVFAGSGRFVPSSLITNEALCPA